jgi:transcriptional regulator with XRE-family HTH domain
MSAVKYPEVRSAYRSARQATEPRISQEHLAELVGVTRRHMIRIENGDHRPAPALRDRIAAELGVDPSTLPAVEDIRPFRSEAA